MFRIFLGFVLATLALAGAVIAQNRASTENEFRTWLEQVVWPQAERKGVSRKIFDSALSDITLKWDLPGVVLPGMEAKATGPQKQAEFRSPATYFQRGRMDGTAAIGRNLAQRHAAALAAVEKSTGVPSRIILAIWARESGFGRVPITHNAFQVLGTRAFADKGDYMIREFVSALEIAEAGHVPVDSMKSSWAGALGQPQFMPASFLAYAADGDGDGNSDIWQSEADTFASIANFLAVHEWDRERDWGFEVSIPNSVSCTLEGPDQGRTTAEWKAMGVARISGRPFPQNEQLAESFLLMPAGRYGPAFLATSNFYVLKRYNRSDLYALYVGNLGDRIQYKMGDFSAGWQQLGNMTRADIASIQTTLEKSGYDVGGVDGLPGFKTRRAIGLWQEKNGRPATCFPTASLKESMGG